MAAIASFNIDSFFITSSIALNHTMDGAHDYHNFQLKLRQRPVWEQVKRYVRSQQAITRESSEQLAAPLQRMVPLSINLDLTTACNYRCDHCIDWDILNSRAKHHEKQLRDSLKELADGGMKSVILIGGGEPTIYPRFVEIVQYLKQLNQQVAIVSNGSRGERLLAACKFLKSADWIRLSLDAGTDETFQAMHKPSKPISLDEICEWVPRMKVANPDVQVGYSFIVTWRGAARDQVTIVENIDELIAAADRARTFDFDYFSVKPFLVRQEDNNAEVMNPNTAEESLDRVIAKIRSAVDEAKKLETDTFKIVESTNLKLLEQKSWQDYTCQPQRCHMQAFRQVLTPLGLFNCPGYRGVPAARIAGPAAYCDQGATEITTQKTIDTIGRFDASKQCANVTCLYNATNWWLQDLIDQPEKLDQVQVTDETTDFFL
ncbi:MAG: hypothetical protein CMJ74_02820 [Planctomycetaceae bacterium]|nr:hypothetical protein [Planctomycetaceae bacterium]